MGRTAPKYFMQLSFCILRCRGGSRRSEGRQKLEVIGARIGVIEFDLVRQARRFSLSRLILVSPRGKSLSRRRRRGKG